MSPCINLHAYSLSLNLNYMYNEFLVLKIQVICSYTDVNSIASVRREKMFKIRRAVLVPIHPLVSLTRLVGVASIDCWVEGTSTGGHTSSSSNCIIEPVVRDSVLL